MRKREKVKMRNKTEMEKYKQKSTKAKGGKTNGEIGRK